VRRQRLVEFSGLFYCLVVNVRVDFGVLEVFPPYRATFIEYHICSFMSTSFVCFFTFFLFAFCVFLLPFQTAYV